MALPREDFELVEALIFRLLLVSKKNRKFKAFLVKTPQGKVGFEFTPRGEKAAGEKPAEAKAARKPARAKRAA